MQRKTESEYIYYISRSDVDVTMPGETSFYCVKINAYRWKRVRIENELAFSRDLNVKYITLCRSYA